MAVILHIDADAMSNRLLRANVEPLNHEVFYASDYDAGIQQADSHFAKLIHAAAEKSQAAEEFAVAAHRRFLKDENDINGEAALQAIEVFRKAAQELGNTKRNDIDLIVCEIARNGVIWDERIIEQINRLCSKGQANRVLVWTTKAPEDSQVQEQIPAHKAIRMVRKPYGDQKIFQNEIENALFRAKQGPYVIKGGRFER